MLVAWPVFFWAKTGNNTQIRKTAKKLLAIRNRVPDNKLTRFQAKYEKYGQEAKNLHVILELT